MPVGDRQQMTDLAVGVVHHRVEHGHVPQARVVGAAGQRDQVHVGVVVDPQLAHARPERPVPHDRRRDHVPAGRARYHIGRDLPAGQRAHREVPQRALPRDRLVDAGDLTRQPARGRRDAGRPLVPLGSRHPAVAADSAVKRGVGRVHQPSLDLQLPAREQVESGLLAVLIVGRGPLRLKHGWRGDRSAAGRCAPRYPAAARTAGTAAGPPTRSWPRAGRRRGRRPA